ncbi:cobalamin B12-binding domain-containing protein [Bradyrhizobium hipponense]|uniref:Cobalamin B12-binding domain-containing protein n=1 Tax=Bradyrhizobium hipponense TaxID=2605638 RepID=A0A5S4YP19_9BRAD|nr:cobalamin B12-binding domain-containing protein [Bradyrhizobium hipponense]
MSFTASRNCTRNTERFALREAVLPLRGIPPIVLATPAPITHRTAEENLGLGYLASILRSKGANVQIIDGWLGGLKSDEIADSIARLPVPLWIGFSCYRSNMARAIEVMQLLRQRGLPKLSSGRRRRGSGLYGPKALAQEPLRLRQCDRRHQRAKGTRGRGTGRIPRACDRTAAARPRLHGTPPGRR